jgi:site-specific recombinase XerD
VSKRYSDEFKESAIKKMMSPNPVSIPKLSSEIGVSDVTLYKWRNLYRNKGVAVPGDKSKPENWSAGVKLAVVIETASFNEVELSEKPLPRHLKEVEVESFLSVIKKKRDRALFMLMLRCGLRVAEVADLELPDIDYQRNQIIVRNGKGAKGRVTYISNDAAEALAAYLFVRPSTAQNTIFLVEKGIHKGKPLSVRGIQKRIEYYSSKTGISISCHQLRHTMATQLLNAGSDLVTIQELLGHTRIETTMRYSRVSNIKVQKDYYKAMERVLQNTTLKQ